MEFAFSDNTQALRRRVQDFFEDHILPRNRLWHQEVDAGQFPVSFMPDLKALAKMEGLWNLFLPGLRDDEPGTRLTNLEYAPLAELMGRVPGMWASEVFNCGAPDTGNMEVLARYGTKEQQERWLTPLLNGEIRSAFAMTEPLVASSDATNVETRIERDGDEYVINGRKWYISGAANERCEIMVVMGKSDPDNPNRHQQQSMILVPMNTPGVTVLRDMGCYGYMDPPYGHPEIIFENVRVPASNMLLGEGRGFEIAQGRLGPGRIHHCMRVIGQAERALALMCERLSKRVAFGKPLSEQGVWRERIAESRIMIDQARFLVMNAAHLMDTVGNKVAAKQIAMIKVAAPNMACQVIDWAIQAHGAGGFSSDFPLAQLYVYARHLRTADGPDEVHRNAIAKAELKRFQ